MAGPTRYTISGGTVVRDDADNGTARPTWRARVYIAASPGARIKIGEGDGKAPHVALRRACEAALEKIRWSW